MKLKFLEETETEIIEIVEGFCSKTCFQTGRLVFYERYMYSIFCETLFGVHLYVYKLTYMYIYTYIPIVKMNNNS